MSHVPFLGQNLTKLAWVICDNNSFPEPKFPFQGRLNHKNYNHHILGSFTKA